MFAKKDEILPLFANIFVFVKGQIGGFSQPYFVPIVDFLKSAYHDRHATTNFKHLLSKLALLLHYNGSLWVLYIFQCQFKDCKVCTKFNLKKDRAADSYSYVPHES
jgi:hypothetical protein